MYTLLFLIGACLCAGASARQVRYYAAEDAEAYFEHYVKEFGKEYVNKLDKDAHFEAFKKNMEEINELNKHSKHAEFGFTQFSDLTHEEFMSKYTGLKAPTGGYSVLCPNIKQDADIPDSGAPDSFDWRSKNVVSEVKDQKNCGSCWSFSATGHIEGQYARKYGELLAFSEQQLVDCTFPNGCLGGQVPVAFMKLIELEGSIAELDYPYKAAPGKCQSDTDKVIAYVVDCTSYNLTQQEKVKQLVYQVGPLSIAIQSRTLRHYKGGIVADNDAFGWVDHAVLVVGYGSEGNKSYWLVKNSWGADWGEEGYFRMERSDNQWGALGMLNTDMATAVVE